MPFRWLLHMGAIAISKGDEHVVTTSCHMQLIGAGMTGAIGGICYGV